MNASGSGLPARVAIFGFARSGRALAGALLARGVDVIVGDDRQESDFEGTEAMRQAGVRFVFGGPGEELLEGAGWLVLSPGVPMTAPLVLSARSRGLPVLAELEVAWRIAQAEAEGENRWVAVTGTNGKSTTTSWIAHILRRAGRPVALAGNIGVPLSDFLAERRPRDFVCEVSSFQLEGIEQFRPGVAVLTNITPDHLDRYADFDEYRAAKERLFANQKSGDVAIVNADDPPAAGARTGDARRVPFSRRGEASGGAWLEAGALVSEVAGSRREILPANKVALQGTNVDATAKSLEGFPEKSVLLILGGRDKHGDFSTLKAPVGRATRLVLTIGEAAPLIEKALSGAAPIERAETMDRAVALASEIARPGDTVLLSPACASFDQYKNFEERGRHFAQLARAAVEVRSPKSEVPRPGLDQGQRTKD